MAKSVAELTVAEVSKVYSGKPGGLHIPSRAEREGGVVSTEERAVELGRFYGERCAAGDAEDRQRTEENLTANATNTVVMDLFALIDHDPLLEDLPLSERVRLMKIAQAAARVAWAS